MVASRELKRALTHHLRLQPMDAQLAYDELLQTEAYVRLLEDERLLDEDPVDILFETIDLQPRMPTVQLLSGFRGTGKTTALLRLRERLDNAGYAAVRIDVKDYLSTERPVRAEEFLLFIAAAAANEARRAGLVDPASEPRLLGSMRKWLSRLNVAEATIQVGSEHANLALTLGLSDPDRLTALRNTIAGATREFARDVAADLEALLQALQPAGRAKELIIIVDSIEHYRGTYGPEGTALAVQAAMEELFSLNADLLDPEINGVHLVYTVPPYLKWLVPGLGNRFQPGGLRIVPAVRVIEPSGTPFAPGIGVLCELVRLRIAAALHGGGFGALTADDVIGSTELEAMVRLTGGVARELVRAAQSVVTRLEDIPASPELVDRALRRLASEYELVDEDVRMLARVEPERDPPIADVGLSLALWARQLDAGNVLCYGNGKEWYAVNPLVASRRRDLTLAGGPTENPDEDGG